MKLPLPNLSAAKVGDPVAPIQFMTGVPQRHVGLRQSANVVLDESPPIDKISLRHGPLRPAPSVRASRESFAGRR